jgi:hypothetical protein
VIYTKTRRERNMNEYAACRMPSCGGAMVWSNKDSIWICLACNTKWTNSRLESEPIPLGKIIGGLD